MWSKCPKCGGRMRNEEVSILGKYGVLGRKSYVFQAHVCSLCGYTELFLKHPKKLAKKED